MRVYFENEEGKIFLDRTFGSRPAAERRVEELKKRWRLAFFTEGTAVLKFALV